MCYELKEVADLWDETMEPVFPREHTAFLGRGGVRVCQALEEELKRLILFIRVVTLGVHYWVRRDAIRRG